MTTGNMFILPGGLNQIGSSLGLFSKSAGVVCPYPTPQVTLTWVSIILPGLVRRLAHF